jgi:NAD+ kinase
VGAISRIALVTHQVPSVAGDALHEVMPVLHRREIEVLLPPGETAKHPDLLGEGARPCCEVAREELAAADLCLVLGGDGTMLRALRLTRDLGLPVAGLNLGRVGFFTAIERDHVVDDLERILDGEFVAHPLMGLATSLNGTGLRAVNDIVLARHREGGICRLSYSLNGVTLFDVRCDGLIVATPAGSSAYNLAAGGPLLGIDLDAFVLTFLAPHALIPRPVVAGARDRLVVRNETAHDGVDLVLDGEHVGTLDPLSALEVTTVPCLATLALLPESDFYRRFRERFV